MSRAYCHFSVLMFMPFLNFYLIRSLTLYPYIMASAPYTTAVASRWHTNGIAGNDYMMTEEDYDIDRLASMSFMLGVSS